MRSLFYSPQLIRGTLILYTFYLPLSSPHILLLSYPLSLMMMVPPANLITSLFITLSTPEYPSAQLNNYPHRPQTATGLSLRIMTCSESSSSAALAIPELGLEYGSYDSKHIIYYKTPKEHSLNCPPPPY